MLLWMRESRSRGEIGLGGGMGRRCDHDGPMLRAEVRDPREALKVAMWKRVLLSNE